jgi:hypothetical protein
MVAEDCLPGDAPAPSTPPAAPSRWSRWLKDGRTPWLAASWVGLALALGAVAAFGTDAGVSYDEKLQGDYGDMVLAWFRSDFRDDRAMHYRDLYLYGGLFDAPAQWIVERSSIGVYETRHILTALLAVLGMFAAWKMAARLGGTRAGFFGALWLALTPTWVGHGWFNPKDIPFGAAAALASFAAMRLAMGPVPLRFRDACFAGVTAGIALGVRPGGVFILAYPCLAAILRVGLEVVRRRRSGEPLRSLRLGSNLAVCGLLVAVLFYPLMLSAWPWAQLDPYDRPLEAMEIARKFRWRGLMLFDGQMLYPDQLPRTYLPVWFGITLPETYALAFVAAVAVLAACIWRKRVRGEVALGVMMLATFVVLPLGAIVATKPVLYDAHRHVLFVLPPLAAAAGCAVSAVFDARWLHRAARAAFGLVAGAAAVVVAIDMIELHPYQYVYFNRASGGLKDKYRHFETDYWGVAYKEAFAWVVREWKPVKASRRIRVASCDHSSNQRLEYYQQTIPGAADKVEIVAGYHRADLFLAGRRYNCHRVPGRIVHTVRRQDAPLLYVRKTRK